MAIGLGRMLGFSLPINFRQPLFAQSVKELWGRWHISLTSFFKNYIYLPLGGNRKGRIRKWLNILVVFLVSGLWHGATFNFIIWGLINGLFQVLEDMLRVDVKKRTRGLLAFFRNIYTVLVLSFSVVFFRTPTLHEAKVFFEDVGRKITKIDSVKIVYNTLDIDWRVYIVVICGVLIVWIVDLLHEKKVSIADNVYKTPFVLQMIVSYGLIFSIVIFGVYGTSYDASAFIYMQF